MAAYMIVQSTVTNEEQFHRYRDAVIPLIAKAGGKLVVGGAAVECLEGHHDGRRVTMFEFPSMDAVHAFWDAPEYVPVKELRRDAATLDIWAVPGV